MSRKYTITYKHRTKKLNVNKKVLSCAYTNILQQQQQPFESIASGNQIERERKSYT
jgi:hypothetical protein